MSGGLAAADHSGAAANRSRTISVHRNIRRNTKGWPRIDGFWLHKCMRTLKVWTSCRLAWNVCFLHQYVFKCLRHSICRGSFSLSLSRAPLFVCLAIFSCLACLFLPLIAVVVHSSLALFYLSRSAMQIPSDQCEATLSMHCSSFLNEYHCLCSSSQPL